MNQELFTNEGPLFSPEKLADLPSLPQWDCDDEASVLRTVLADVFEKHLDVLKSDPTEPQTKFFVVNRLLHGLGYVYSINEPLPIQDDARVQVDYSLFKDSQSFNEVEPVRGTTSFFRNAVALCQGTAWGEPLKVSEDPEVAAGQPLVLMDIFLGSSGVDYGIVTNGKQWRLVNRASSELLQTGLTLDIEKLVGGDEADFKSFLILFGAASVARNDEGTCFLDSLLPY